MKTKFVEMGKCRVCGTERELVDGVLPKHPLPMSFGKSPLEVCEGAGQKPLPAKPKAER